ncbi:MAG: hypothetical protein ACRECD_00175 [Burkholderiaceae bacterium]
MAVTALWSHQAPSLGWRQGLAWATVLAGGVVAACAWWATPEGELRWDGQTWWWSASGEPLAGVVTVALDLQRRMLLCWCGEPGPSPSLRQWLWLERKRQPGRWDDLRRAVYSRARTDALTDVDALPGGESKAAKP